MRNGFKVFDADTHVQPTAEAMEPYLDHALRERVGDLDSYRVPIRVGSSGEVRQPPYKHYWRFSRGEGWGTLKPRYLGEASAREGEERRHQRFMGTRFPAEASIDDPHVRLRDMDEEGVDVHLMVPAGANGHPDPAIEFGFIQANHRFLDDFCAADPARLKSLIVVSARCVDESVKEIETWGQQRWAVGIQPYLPLDYPIDHPDLNPIWQAAQEEGLPVVHHSFSTGYPGYRDLWNSPFIGRAASHPWGAMRAMAAFMGGGIMDRYPEIKLAVLESGFGWLPFWARRLDDQAVYVGYVAEGLRHKPSEYMTGGRFACSLVIHEGEEMLKMVNQLLGDEVVMFSSDYPHAECRFPESVDRVLAWGSLSQPERQRLLWDNAVRFFGEP